MYLAKWGIDKRYINLQLISGDKQGEILSNLNIDSKITFNTSDSVGGGSSEANIVINGITVEKMAFLSTTSTQWIKEAIQNKIIIDAGYERKHAIIFSGIITEARPTINDANYNITIKALAGFDLQLSANKSYTFKGSVKASTIANTFARDLNFMFINGLKEDKDVVDYHTDAMSILDNMRYLAKICNCDVYCSYNRLIIKNSGCSLKSDLLEEHLKIDESNLIGGVVITPLGCDIKIKMNPAVMGGMPAKIKSKNFPQIEDQKFTVQSFNHAGDTHGNDWSTHIKLVRDDILMD